MSGDSEDFNIGYSEGFEDARAMLRDEFPFGDGWRQVEWRFVLDPAIEFLQHHDPVKGNRYWVRDDH